MKIRQNIFEFSEYLPLNCWRRGVFLQLLLLCEAEGKTGVIKNMSFEEVRSTLHTTAGFLKKTISELEQNDILRMSLDYDRISIEVPGIRFWCYEE